MWSVDTPDKQGGCLVIGAPREIQSRLQDPQPALTHVRDLEQGLAAVQQRWYHAVIVDLEGLTSDPERAVRLLCERHAAVLSASCAPVEADLAVRLLACGTLGHLNWNADQASIEAALGVICERRAKHHGQQFVLHGLRGELEKRRDWVDDVSQFLSQWTHDLRTPVGILQGFCSNLLDNIHGPLDSEKRDALERMQGAIDLLTELLETSRSHMPELVEEFDELPERVPQRRRFSLVDVCKDVSSVVSPRAESAQVTIELNAANQPEIWADRGRVSQVLLNLLANAIRFAPARSKISVDLRTGIDSNAQTRCELIVRDQGPGIAAGDRETIFTAGYTTNQSDGHSGMGLAISRDVAREHGGELTLLEQQGQGSAFLLSLPVDARKRGQSALKVRVLDDPALVGQLLVELSNKERLALEIEHPKDMAHFASHLLEAREPLTFVEGSGALGRLTQWLTQRGDVSPQGES